MRSEIFQCENETTDACGEKTFVSSSWSSCGEQFCVSSQLSCDALAYYSPPSIVVMLFSIQEKNICEEEFSRLIHRPLL